MLTVLIIAAAALAAFLVLRAGGRLPRAGGKARAGERELYRNLLRKSFGDKAQAERLIEAERRRNPGAGRRVWLKDAVERWERHNR